MGEILWNYTVDLQAVCEWFRKHGIKTVAMKSTGVYWIPLFAALERWGFECLLLSSRSLRKVAGQKTDGEDVQWIQTLHSYGLLKGSLRPEGDLVAMWTLLRHRAQLVEHRAPHIQQALLQMNIQLSQAGRTGLAAARREGSARRPGTQRRDAEAALAGIPGEVPRRVWIYPIPGALPAPEPVTHYEHAFAPQGRRGDGGGLCRDDSTHHQPGDGRDLAGACVRGHAACE